MEVEDVLDRTMLKREIHNIDSGYPRQMTEERPASVRPGREEGEVECFTVTLRGSPDGATYSADSSRLATFNRQMAQPMFAFTRA